MQQKYETEVCNLTTTGPEITKYCCTSLMIPLNSAPLRKRVRSERRERIRLCSTHCRSSGAEPRGAARLHTAIRERFHASRPRCGTRHSLRRARAQVHTAHRGAPPGAATAARRPRTDQEASSQHARSSRDHDALLQLRRAPCDLLKQKR